MILNLNKRRFRFWSTLLAFSGIISLSSCEDSFLDVVPDNVNTIDKVFNLRNEAEKYLFTCYSYMPSNGSLTGNPAFLAGDELWIPDQFQAITAYPLNIAMGLQRVGNPYFNAWDGDYQAKPMFQGIRHCNILIENLSDMSQVPDMTDSERERWIAEGKFLKAYYHFYLLRMYGAVPILDKSIDIDADVSAFNVPRASFDENIDYIVGLLDETIEVLPPTITDVNDELGRVTSTIARGLKARVLLTSASPLFNGNPDLAGVVNKDGSTLYSSNVDPSKWQLAADAALEAINAAESAGHKLYEFSSSGFDLTDTTELKLSIRNAVTERWNSEVIWGNTQSRTIELQRQAMSPLSLEHSATNANKIISPTLKIAEQFYTKNGVPIQEDKTLDFSDILELREANASEKNNIRQGYVTSILNYDREPRFYADLGFDGAIWYKYDSQSDDTKFHIEGKYNDYAGSNEAFFFNMTGYYLKKVVNWNQSFGSSSVSYRDYAWPELRLADLYLMYAEALNEAQGPSAEVFEYLDKVRERAGLQGVQESWANFSVNPDQPNSKEGLRKIIHHERNIEMAFEGSRFWDLRRWKEAVNELNKPVRGWNVFGADQDSYYQIRTIYQQRFVAPRDYFWPIAEYALLQNSNLVQNPGW